MTRNTIRKFIQKSVVLKVCIYGIFWALPATLLFFMIFSVYPNYILKGHYNRTFSAFKSLADNGFRKIFPHKADYNTSILIDSINVAIKEDSGLPPKVFQPLMEVKNPDTLPETAYFTKPVKSVAYNSAMIPNPFTTYAPLPGKIGGILFHNRQQFRYPLNLEKKKVNEIRIFITGGSVAWGSCATDVDATIAGFMEKALRKQYPHLDVKVITAAAVAWSTTQERIWIFNRISEYEPDMIISYSGFNDLYMYFQSKADLYDCYGNEGGYFRYAIRAYDFYNRGEAISLLGVTDESPGFKPSDFPRKTLKNVKIINSYLKSASVPYVYVLQSAGKEKYNARDYDLYLRLKNDLLAQSKSDGYQFIDHLDIFHNRLELLVDFVHPGDRGYQIIANDLLARIELSPLLAKVKSRTEPLPTKNR